MFLRKPGSGEKSNVNEEVAQELHKPVIKKFKKIKSFDSRFSWNMIMSSKNCNAKYLLFVIDVSTKYFWIKPFNDKN